MTTIFGQFHDVVGRNSVATISFRSIRTRAGTDSPGMITTEAEPITLRDGVLPDTEVDPGTTVVTLEGAGVSEQWVIDTPTEGRHDIAGLVEMQFDYEPAVVSQAVAARDEAIRQAAAAAASAKTATDQASHVDDVVKDGAATVRGEFTDLTERSEAARTGAETAQTAAEKARGEAGTARDDAGTARDAAEAQAKDAAASATASADSAATSDTNQKNAKNYQELSWKGRTDSLNAAKDAKAAKADAETARDESRTHAESAASSCSDAQDAAVNAAGEVKDDLTDLAGQAKTAASAAKTSETNAKTSEDKARQYAESAGEVVADGVPNATDTTAGKVKLAGDLGGTADAPTVPGLADKADTKHTHAVGDIDGLDTTVDAVSAATYEATGGALVKRSADGTASFAVPTGANHAATKGYVDSTKTSAVSTAKTYTDSRFRVVDSEDAVGTEAGVFYFVKE
ncbi:hypothetical protein [Corynebacterium variabile]|uniref:hypothetical protein n=1 Tax=Corynebacterium variabile TaxID=1727 RepID=UPI003FCF4918